MSERECKSLSSMSVGEDDRYLHQEQDNWAAQEVHELYPEQVEEQEEVGDIELLHRMVSPWHVCVSGHQPQNPDDAELQV
jgi:hypothetical protein